MITLVSGSIAIGALLLILVAYRASRKSTADKDVIDRAKLRAQQREKGTLVEAYVNTASHHGVIDPIAHMYGMDVADDDYDGFERVTREQQTTIAAILMEHPEDKIVNARERDRNGDFWATQS